jgi:uncharacterized protein YciI
MIFAVEFHYLVSREQREPAHPEHAANLKALAERGALLLAGPLPDDNAGLLIYDVGDRAELQRILDDEPYAAAGYIGQVRVRRWQPGKGSWIPNATKN